LGVYSKLTLEADDQRTAAPTSNEVVFKWNNRECRGIELHSAVLREDLPRVQALLDAHPDHLTQRFRYSTRSPTGAEQEGSGEAIHLAASRSSYDILQLLIERRAALDATVTRDHKPHYDVLHAAVFCEGRGGQKDIIECLINAKAMPQKNLDGHYPLHKAYQTGGCAIAAIPLLRDNMRDNGLLGGVDDWDGPEVTALKMGINNGKLTGEQLSRVSPLSTMTLKVFIHSEPYSIAPFFDRMAQEDFSFTAAELAQNVTLDDICKVMRDCPDAAEVLLEALTFEPEADSPGWHPLPTRMSFAPRTMFERIQNQFNPFPETFSYYKAASRWEFDASTFTAPEWHKDVLAKLGQPVYDVKIEVCALPELVCAEFFAAASESEHDGIFNNRIVYALIRTVWWGGAYKVDILQLLITILGLVLLTFERGRLDFAPVEELAALTEVQERRLRPHGQTGTTGFGSGDTLNLSASGCTPAFMFLGARGFVDLMHELMQIAGYRAIGKSQEYISFGNVMDLLRAFLAMSCYAYPDAGLGVQVILILLYWFRLLEVSFSEKLMRELLPIIQLVRGLAPSCVVCFIAVCAFTHARWVMTAKPLWPDTVHESFALLITAELPPDLEDNLGLVFAYLAVCCFSIFFLNIFIGVIGENYTLEKEAANLSLLKKKCGLCLTFLLRARMVPARWFSRRVADAVLTLSMLLMVALLACEELGYRTSPLPVLTMVVLQMLALFSCYQDPEKAWSRNDEADPANHRYMWVAYRGSVGQAD